MIPAEEGNNFVVEVDIRIQQMWYQSQSGQMSLRENFRIPASGFTELASILGKFHDLAKRIENDLQELPKE